MRAGLFPGQGIEADVVLESLSKEHPLVERACAILDYDLVHRVELVSRRPRPILPVSLSQPAIFVAGLISYVLK